MVFPYTRLMLLVSNPHWSPNSSANGEKGSHQLTQARKVLLMGKIGFPKFSLGNVFKTFLEIPGENPLSNCMI